MDSVGAIYSVDDTIVAIASAAGGAARGLVRLSGPRAASVAVSLLESGTAPNDPRAPAAEGTIADRATTDVPIAKVSVADLPAAALVGAEPRVRTVMLRLPGIYSPLPTDWYYWPPGRSYTGQEVVELHTIGAPPLLDALVRALCSGGARLARPGEFTLRAFLSGRMDLTQAEAVLGVIDAADRRQWETAVRQLAGGLSLPLGELRADLLDLLADIEAGLDFADEDIRFIARDEIECRLSKAIEAAEGVARQLEGRRLAGDRPRAVLVGPPNAGKSSLFNALVQRPAALVADAAGTTRDYLTAPLDCDGITWELIDTPGVAPYSATAGFLVPAATTPAPNGSGFSFGCGSTDWPAAPLFGLDVDRTATAAEPAAAKPMAAGQASPAAQGLMPRSEHAPTDAADLDGLVAAVAMRCIEQADLLVLCLPVDGSADDRPAERWGAHARELAAAGGLPDKARRPRPCLVVYTKSDLCGEPAGPASCNAADGPVDGSSGGGAPARTVEQGVGPALAVSSRTGSGLAELRERLRQIGVELRSGQGDAVASTALRCGDAIDQARTGLAEARAACRAGEGDELLAERLRGVLDALGRIVGAVYTEELLGNIFSRFCVGK